jgi:hypothetical protein
MNEMNNNKKKKYIENHLHELDENTVNELFEKIYSVVNKNELVAGYDATGTPILKKQLVEDILQSEVQIRNGHFITLEQLEEESKNWE